MTINLRNDLMELGSEALLALANPGFVKRAQKDVAAGNVPELKQDEDGTVHAIFEDGVHTSISPTDSLRDARCSCAASSMCRHRVTLVLAYQLANTDTSATATANPDIDNSFWTPAQFDDAAIAAGFSVQVIEQARKLAIARPIAKVRNAVISADGISNPGVILPMSHVRFFSRTSLAHARCDCQQGSACAHVVLATWAFRQAQQSQPGVAEVSLEVLLPGQNGETVTAEKLLQTDSAKNTLADIEAYLWSVWRDGSAQALPGLEARHASLQAGVQALGWTWVSTALDDVWHMLEAQAHRSNRFDIQDLSDAIAQLWARLQAARHADTNMNAFLPASQVLGIGQKGEVALDLLRLVSLGAQFWRDDISEGVSLVFADPDTQAVSVLERAWPLAKDAKEASADISSLLQRRLAGLSVKLLAGGQVITRAARRRANACLELGANARQTSVLPLSPKSFDDLVAPLKFSQLGTLRDYLRQRPPANARAIQSGADWHVLELASLNLEHWSWDAARQTLFAAWHGEPENRLHAYLPYQHLTPGAVDAFARALNGEFGELLSLAGPVWLEHGQVCMQPMTVMTAQRAIVLALEAANPQQMSLQQMPLPVSAEQALLRETRYLLNQLLRQGVRHATPSQRTRLDAQARQMADAGYSKSAALLQAIFTEAGDNHNTQSAQGLTKLENLSGLNLLIQELLA
ncbi:SWIM zinc finger family protein [Undibacterium sp. TJN19]|uniref:SWIM zinc finger family protein n=1 Tax=Undibacterium sp. TJN19 TaxID=3413055 RepID=UPI003BF2D726